jgi:hypothetical protein
MDVGAQSWIGTQHGLGRMPNLRSASDKHGTAKLGAQTGTYPNATIGMPDFGLKADPLTRQPIKMALNQKHGVKDTWGVWAGDRGLGSIAGGAAVGQVDATWDYTSIHGRERQWDRDAQWTWTRLEAGAPRNAPHGHPRPQDLRNPVRAPPGRLSALRVSHSKSALQGVFAWARRALNRQNRAVRHAARILRRRLQALLQPRPRGHGAGDHDTE